MSTSYRRRQPPRATDARASPLIPNPPPSPAPSSRYRNEEQYDYPSYNTADIPRGYQSPPYDYSYEPQAWDDGNSTASYQSAGGRVFEIDTLSQEEAFLPSSQAQPQYEVIEPDDEVMVEVPPPTPARKAAPTVDGGRGRKRRASPAPQSQQPQPRHPSDHRIAAAREHNIRSTGQEQMQSRLTDTLSQGHPGQPRSYRGAPTNPTRVPNLEVTAARRPNQPVQGSKLRQSTKFDTPSESGRRAGPGRSTEVGPVDRGSPRADMRRAHAQVQGRGRGNMPPPPPPSYNNKVTTTSASTKKTTVMSFNPPVSLKASSSQATPPTITTLAISKTDSAEFSLSDDDDSSSSSSSHESALGDLIGDKDLVVDTPEPEAAARDGSDGVLQLNMPKSIDQILKKIIGPMVKRVVASRDDMKESNHEEWDWGRLETLTADLNNGLGEAKKGIQEAQRNRQGAIAEAMKSRIEQEEKTTQIYREHGAAHRSMCNDLTGNTRPVKRMKIKQEKVERAQSVVAQQ